MHDIAQTDDRWLVQPDYGDQTARDYRAGVQALQDDDLVNALRYFDMVSSHCRTDSITSWLFID
jgi:hypothetical protein